MRLPKLIKYRNATIKLIKTPIDEARRGDFLGLYDPNENSIRISEEIKNKAEIAETLVHEILHLIIDKSKRPVVSEEKTVDNLAKELIILLYRNKHILNFIQRCLK